MSIPNASDKIDSQSSFGSDSEVAVRSVAGGDNNLAHVPRRLTKQAAPIRNSKSASHNDPEPKALEGIHQ